MALKHRIPVRVRHYWKLLATCAAVLVAFTVVFSTVRVAPLVTSASDSGRDEVTQNIEGTKDLFDATIGHSIKLTFRDADFQNMLDKLWDEDEKEYLEADLTIDGTTIPSVGIRLKGNSTLGQLTRNGESRPRGMGPGGGRGGLGADGGPGGPGGGAPPAGFPQMPADGAAPDAGGGNQPGAAASGAAQPGGDQPGGAQGGGMPDGGMFGGGRGGFGTGGLKAEEPEALPWLIRFDEFVEGRRYQGHREVAVRVAGMGGGKTVMNEAVSLNVLAAAGEAVQRYAYTSFTVNDRPTTARLVVEHPDEHFADRIGGHGVLYKSLAGGSFTDKGDDPTDYVEDFKQITQIGSQDLQPVIDLVRWVTTASDKEFDEHLGDHVDIPSFSRYLAEQNLLINFDDMAGPGRNYYLWYDLTTKKFSVVGWDYNLALSGSAEQDPHQSVSMGGGRGGPGGGQGFQPPEGMQLPEGMQPPGGGNGGPGGGRGLGGHKLKERFLASKAFTAAYDQAYRELYQKIYAGGAATKALDSALAVLTTVDGYDQKAGTDEATKLRTLIQQRNAFLAKNKTITGS